MPGPGIFLKSGMPLISGVSGDVFRHCVRAFLLFSSTFCVHFYYFPALFSVRISTVFSTVGVHFYYVAALFCVHYFGLVGVVRQFFGLIGLCSSTFVCAFLLCSSIFCVYFHCDPTLFLCVYFYCAPAFFVHAFLLCFSSDTLPTPVLMLFTA